MTGGGQPCGEMDVLEKLTILTDAAKYDAACTSSGGNRRAKAGYIGSDFLALRLVEIVFFLQFCGDFLAAPEKKVLIEPLALLVDIDGNYMDMAPVYVFVLVNYERLLSEAEFFQILAGKDFKILIRELIIRVRIERYMKDRLFCPPHHRHELSEIFGNTTDVDLPV